MKIKPVLNFFTTNYPYNKGETFISPELNSLSKKFSLINIFPLKAKYIDKKNKPTPVNCEVLCYNDNSISTKILLKTLVNHFFDIVKLFAIEIVAEKKIIQKLKYSKKIFLKLVFSIACSDRVLKSINFSDTNYSFWMNENAIALAYLKQKNKINSFSLKIHGFDIFNEVHKEQFIPFRCFVYQHAKSIYNISKSNNEYLISNYPKFKSKYKVDYLCTIKNIEGLNLAPDKLILCSCSNLIPIKRVHLIIEILSFVKIPFHWFHIGSGHLEEELKTKAEDKLPAHSYTFLGQLTNIQVQQFLASQPISFFINTSSSEGLPVSMMEAISYGIPLIGTNVGSVKEIILSNTGLLLDVNFNSIDVANKVSSYFEKHIFASIKERKNIYEFWNSNFNADNKKESLIL